MADKKPKKVSAKKAEVKAVPIGAHQLLSSYIGATLLDPKKMYKLTDVQRAAIKPKATSISTIKSELTGAELNVMLKRIKSNPSSFGIER